MKRLVLIFIALFLLVSCSKHDRNSIFQNAVSDDEVRELFIKRNIRDCQRGFVLGLEGLEKNSKDLCDCILNATASYIKIDDLRTLVAPTTYLDYYEQDRLNKELYSALNFGISQCYRGY